MKAAILQGFADVDALATVETITLTGSQLRAGMVLVDPDFDTPAVGLDQKVRATRSTGKVAFLTADLERGGWTRMAFSPKAQIKVMAR